MYKLIAFFVLIGVLHQAQCYRIYDDREIDLGDTLAQLSAKCVIAQMEKMPTIIGCIKNEVEKLEAMVNKESDVKLINKDACCGLPTLNACFTVIKNSCTSDDITKLDDYLVRCTRGEVAKKGVTLECQKVTC